MLLTRLPSPGSSRSCGRILGEVRDAVWMAWPPVSVCAVCGSRGVSCPLAALSYLAYAQFVAGAAFGLHVLELPKQTQSTVAPVPSLSRA